MNQLLTSIYESKSVQDEKGNIINPFPTATPYEIGTLFDELIKKNNFQRTLEIGMAYGLSTMFICQAHKDKGSGQHIAIDPNQSTEWKSIGLLNIERACLSENFRLFEANSHEVLPQLLTQGEKIDFAFIDGSHHFDYALLDFFYIDKLLKVGGYIAFDDIWMPGIRKVLYFILRNRMYEIVKIRPRSNLRKRIQRYIKRWIQNPLERDSQGIKLLPDNICVIKKIAEESSENRPWNFFKQF
ncbi:MAG: class I SAM-dependent methyltransferase [Calothrix sp. MO_192.B10]|nr:class I SAM-dependent methyltransferase [Calothrix sp. MO_192.B10]